MKKVILAVLLTVFVAAVSFAGNQNSQGSNCQGNQGSNSQGQNHNSQH